MSHKTPDRQMRILGIDYGKKKIGLSITEGPLAEPYGVIRFKSEEEALKKVEQVIKVEQVKKVVVGVSEGKMGKESKNFSLILSQRLKIPVVTIDESLTSQEAQKLSIEAGIRRKKRKGLEDAYAATLILQSFLDL